MKTRTKRKVAFLLATIMLISTTCFATDNQETILASVQAESGLMHHAYNTGAVGTMRSTASNDAYISFSEDAEVIYDYQLTYYSEDPSKVGVLLDFNICSQDNAISLTLSGDVRRIAVSDELVILRGPLYTTERIGGIDYEISAGFTKVESRDEISVGLVFTSRDNGFQELYSFGETVLTDEEYDTWRNSVPLNIGTVASNGNVAIPASMSTDEHFTYVGRDTGTMNVSGVPTSASGTGSTLYVFKDEEHDRIMAGVETTCYKLTEDKFTSGGYLAAGLYYMKVSFDRVGAKGNILGFDKISLPASGNQKSLNGLFGAFASLAGAIPSPYGTLAAAFFSALSDGDFSANPTVTFSGNTGTETQNAFVSLSGMNAVNQVNFDDKMCPIVLSLTNSGSSAGNSSWTVTLEAEYEVDLTYAAFYIPVSEAEVGVSVYFAG